MPNYSSIFSWCQKYSQPFRASIIAILLLCSQTYRWKFQVAGQNLNWLLILTVLAIIYFSLANIYTKSNIKNQDTLPKKYTGFKIWANALSFLAGLSGLIGTFSHGLTSRSLGLGMVLFFLPVTLFQLIFRLDNKKDLRASFWHAVNILFLTAGVLSILQYFFLWFLPNDWWGNTVEPKRAIAFFGHPNSLGLFLVPLLSARLPSLLEIWKQKTYKSFWTHWTPWFLGVLSVGFSLSRAGWIALFVTCGIFSVFKLKLKSLLIFGATSLIIFTLILAYSPILQYRFSPRVLLSSQSTSARPLLWSAGWRAILQSPLTGLGLGGFEKDFAKFQLPASIGTHASPHNFFLGMWVETGLMGIAFAICLFIFLIFNFIQSRTSQGLALSLFLLAFFLQGMVDVAYFRNDLSLVFWLSLALFWPKDTASDLS